MKQKIKYGIDENDSTIQNEPHFQSVSQLDESLPKKMNVNKNTSLKPYIKRLPKLFRITGDVLDDIKYLKRAECETKTKHSFS